MKNAKKVLNKQTKKILEYTAVFEKAPEGGYNVYFPSLPGCFTFGVSLKHAKEMAKDVLSLWLGVLKEKNNKIPEQKEILLTSIRVAFSKK